MTSILAVGAFGGGKADRGWACLNVRLWPLADIAYAPKNVC
jgi:hypothetical protein